MLKLLPEEFYQIYIQREIIKAKITFKPKSSWRKLMTQQKPNWNFRLSVIDVYLACLRYSS